MSTRCVTHFTWGGKVQARVYRHCDGYPSGAGTDILRFLRDVEAQTRDTRFNDPSYLAAKYVVWLAGQFANGDKPLDFLSVGVVLEDPGDIEFRYVIECGQRGTHPKVACFDVDGNGANGGECEIPPLPADEKPWRGGPRT